MFTQGQVTIPAGASSGTFSVPIIGDTEFELDETFTVTLGNPSAATIADATAMGTILDDDPLAPDLPIVSIADASIVEGDAGQQILSFTVSLSKAATAPTRSSTPPRRSRVPPSPSPTSSPAKTACCCRQHSA